MQNLMQTSEKHAREDRWLRFFQIVLFISCCNSILVFPLVHFNLKTLFCLSLCVAATVFHIALYSVYHVVVCDVHRRAILLVNALSLATLFVWPFALIALIGAPF